MSALIRRAFVLLALLAASAACGSNTTTTPTQPSTATTITDTFSGTLNRNGALTHAFPVQTAGTVTATLRLLDPADAVIGLSLGTWNGSACAVVLANDSAKLGAVVVGSVSSLGNLCVRLYDVGVIADPVSYEVDVVHP